MVGVVARPRLIRCYGAFVPKKPRTTASTAARVWAGVLGAARSDSVARP